MIRKVPLTSSQEYAYSHFKSNPTLTSYVDVLIELPTPVTLRRTRALLAEVARLHPALRATIVEHGARPHFSVARTMTPRVLVVSDTDDDLRLSMRKTLGAVSIALSDRPLWFAAYRSAHGGRTAVALRLHHLIADGASAQVIEEDLLSLASGEVPQSRDEYSFDRYHEDSARSTRREREVADAARFVQDAPFISAFPRLADARIAPVPAEHLLACYRYAGHWAVENARMLSTSPFAVLAAAVAIACSAVSGTVDFLILAPRSNRNLHEARIVGWLADMGFLRMRLDVDEPFAASVRASFRAVGGMLSQARVPSPRIVDALTQQAGRFGIGPCLAICINAPEGKARWLPDVSGEEVPRELPWNLGLRTTLSRRRDPIVAQTKPFPPTLNFHLSTGSAPTVSVETMGVGGDGEAARALALLVNVMSFLRADDNTPLSTVFPQLARWRNRPRFRGALIVDEITRLFAMTPGTRDGIVHTSLHGTELVGQYLGDHDVPIQHVRKALAAVGLPAPTRILRVPLMEGSASD